MSQSGPAPTGNTLLDSLQQDDLALLRPHLEQIQLERRTVLIAPGEVVVSSPHEVSRAKCHCIAGLGGFDPVGPGMPGSMGNGVSTTSGAGGR